MIMESAERAATSTDTFSQNLTILTEVLELRRVNHGMYDTE